MSKRTNTAQWEEKYQRWRIAVQKDGVRKQFYSSTPGRTGQREANAKADRWLDDGIGVKARRVEDLYQEWYATVVKTTGTGNQRNVESRWRTRILPAIGRKRITGLTEQDLQDVVNDAYSDGLAKKSLQSLCADMRAFCKWCRAKKLTTFHPEGLHVPAGARPKGKKVLQPDALITLFRVDTTLYRPPLWTWCRALRGRPQQGSRCSPPAVPAPGAAGKASGNTQNSARPCPETGQTGYAPPGVKKTFTALLPQVLP